MVKLNFGLYQLGIPGEEILSGSLHFVCKAIKFLLYKQKRFVKFYYQSLL